MDGRKGRKLLVATIGLATIAYVACSDADDEPTVANLMAPPTGGSDGSGGMPTDGATDVVIIDAIANLMVPPGDNG
jgi:hypothetical protein